jgi:glycosyltransferase involved in cell wall biosynthesis
MQLLWPDSTYIVIPSYKSIDTLKTFIPELLKWVPKKKVCVVDDASMDGTGQYCSEMQLTYLSHSVNQGKGTALVTGFAYLMKKNARWIITMDADGQHAPEDLEKFLTFVNNNESTGICIGTRLKKIGTMPLSRIFSNVITSKILSLICGTRILDSQCGYRIYSTDFLKKISIKYARFEMESEVIMKAAKLGFPVSFVDVRTLYLSGQSHISHIKDTVRWVRAVISIWLKLGKDELKAQSNNSPE